MITSEQVKALLESDADEPILVVVSGSAAVVPASALATDRWRGALEIITREDLVAQLGTDAGSGRDLEAIAARLDAAVTRLGA
jgi:hypothetical protein